MRIKTIGDGYMFSTKLTEKVTAHAVNGALFAKYCIDSLAAKSEEIIKKMMLRDNSPLEARAGCATGEIIAGVVPGKFPFLFRLFRLCVISFFFFLFFFKKKKQVC